MFLDSSSATGATTRKTWAGTTAKQTPNGVALSAVNVRLSKWTSPMSVTYGADWPLDAPSFCRHSTIDAVNRAIHSYGFLYIWKGLEHSHWTFGLTFTSNTMVRFQPSSPKLKLLVLKDVNKAEWSFPLDDSPNSSGLPAIFPFSEASLLVGLRSFL